MALKQIQLFAFWGFHARCERINARCERRGPAQ